MHSEAKRPLVMLSPFLVSKVLEGIVGTNFNAKKMAWGGLLVKINTKQQSDSLLALNFVSNYKVSVELSLRMTCPKHPRKISASLSSQGFIREKGVPQGGVLSVTVFTVKISGLTKVIPPSVSYSLYVNDVQISVSSCSLSG